MAGLRALALTLVGLFVDLYTQKKEQYLYHHYSEYNHLRSAKSCDNFGKASEL